MCFLCIQMLAAQCTFNFHSHSALTNLYMLEFLCASLKTFGLSSNHLECIDVKFLWTAYVWRSSSIFTLSLSHCHKTTYNWQRGVVTLCEFVNIKHYTFLHHNELNSHIPLLDFLWLKKNLWLRHNVFFVHKFILFVHLF